MRTVLIAGNTLALAGTLALTGAALLLAGCPSPAKNGNGGPGAECTANADCKSSLCVLPDPNTPIGFCSAPCTAQSDCSDFAGGCCVPTQDGLQVCAISALCSAGDAGLGDPCPGGADGGGGHDQCALGLTCLYNDVVNFCSQPCTTIEDCGGASQECCEDVGGVPNQPQLFCVLDAQCGAAVDAGPVPDAGPMGPGGDDGGPFYAGLFVNGVLTADTNQFQASAGPGFETLVAPPLAKNLELDPHADLQLGSYACDGGGVPTVDGGVLYAVLNTKPDNSFGFAQALPVDLQGLVIPFQCGEGVVTGNPALAVRAANITITAFTPGQVRSIDAGPLDGHMQGTAYWKVVPAGDGGGHSLELRARFDVPLIAP